MNGHNHEPKVERMIFGKIEEALCRLTCAVEEQTAWLKANHSAATKEDLKRETAKIIAAIRASNPANDAAIVEATKDLKASNDALEEAVNKNK